jgi:hypothetical protein
MQCNLFQNIMPSLPVNVSVFQRIQGNHFLDVVFSFPLGQQKDLFGEVLVR